MIDKSKYSKALEAKDGFSRSEPLNLPGYHTSAAISAYMNPGGGGVTISDCSRSINLEIDDYNEESWVNTLFKLDTLIDVLKDERKAVALVGRKKGYKL